MLKKKLLFVGILILVLALINLVNSYSVARANHEASLKISLSENALIAIPENLVIKIKNPGAQVVENNFVITNNFGKTIEVFVDCDNLYILFDDLIVFSGDTEEIIVNINDNSVFGNVNLVITVRWDGGRAIIEKTLRVEVETD